MRLDTEPLEKLCRLLLMGAVVQPRTHQGPCRGEDEKRLQLACRSLVTEAVTCCKESDMLSDLTWHTAGDIVIPQEIMTGTTVQLLATAAAAKNL